MTEAQAKALVARLVSAYPRERLDVANVALLVEKFEELHDPAAALETVNKLIDNEQRLPPIATVRAAYMVERRNQKMLGAARLPELPEAEIEANLVRRDEMASRIGRRMP